MENNQEYEGQWTLWLCYGVGGFGTLIPWALLAMGRVNFAAEKNFGFVVLAFVAGPLFILFTLWMQFWAPRQP